LRPRLEAFKQVCFHGKGKESRDSGLKRGGKSPCLRPGGGRRRKVRERRLTRGALLAVRGGRGWWDAPLLLGRPALWAAVGRRGRWAAGVGRQAREGVASARPRGGFPFFFSKTFSKANFEQKQKIKKQKTHNTK